MEDVNPPLWVWAAFVLFVLVLLAFDILYFRRTGGEIGLRKSLFLASVYISIALLFGAGVHWFAGPDVAVAYITGFVLEEALSLDNVFVFVVLFQAFRVPPEFQHRVLFWGVLGALLLRGTFIFAGAALLRQFDWLMLVLAVVLILSGARLLWTGGVSREDPKNSRIYRFVARRMHVTQDFEGKDFIVFRSGRWHATPLLLTLIVVETTDVMFAFDSIPAVFSVTKDSFIVFTSNVFAVLTMRSLYFALRGTVERFRYLKPALALLLVIIGLKIVAERFIEIPVWATLGVTLAVVAAGVLLSIWHRHSAGISASRR